jgi:hypothetical protein
MGLLEKIVDALNPLGIQLEKLLSENWKKVLLYGIGGFFVVLFLILKALSGQG